MMSEESAAPVMSSAQRLTRTFLGCLALVGALAILNGAFTLWASGEVLLTGATLLQVGLPFALWVALALWGHRALRPAILAFGDDAAAASRTQSSAWAALAAETNAVAVERAELDETGKRYQEQLVELSRSQRQIEAERTDMISQRSQLEDKTISLSRFKLTLDAMPDIVVMVDMDGKLIYQNVAALQALPRLSLHRGLRMLRFLSKESARFLRAEVIPLVLEEGLWNGEVDMRTRFEQPAPMHMTAIAQRDRFGNPEVIVLVAHDLREERRLRESLTEREALNRAVIDSLAEGVIVEDREGEIVAWNESAARILGIAGDRMIGRAFDESGWESTTMDGVPIDAYDHPITRARLYSERVDGQVLRVVRDGAMRDLAVNARPMFTNDFDDRPGAVSTFTDVTEQHAMHREMETLSVVVRQSHYAVVMTDANARITWVNGAFEQLTGYSLAEVTGQAPGTLLQGVHTAADVVERMRSAIKNETNFNGELLNYRKDGTPYWVELSITPLHETGGKLTGFVGLSRDVTARRAADRERQTLAAALAVAADGVAIIDAGGVLEFVNHAFARQSGARSSDLVNRVWLELYAEDAVTELTRAVRAELTSLGFWHGEVQGRRVSGEVFPQEVSLTLLPQGGIVAVVRDISERKAAEDRLKFLSTRDELTGLLNRRGFMQEATEVIREASARGRSCALLYGDLDSFKLINDKFGHPVGDIALQEISRLLSNTFRATDLVARLGGDEFTVLACDIGREDIDRVLARLDEKIVAHNAARADDPEQAWVLGVSLGVAFAMPDELTDVDALLRDADAAQYLRKSQRKVARRAA